MSGQTCSSDSRRSFLRRSGLALTGLAFSFQPLLANNSMQQNDFEVLIIGGSYSGLAAAMALGRALRRVLIIDSGKPCNRQTPHSHNFLTQDGQPPGVIVAAGREQVARYPTVSFLTGTVTSARPVSSGFAVTTETGEILNAQKLLFATGIRDLMPPIPGFAECWGISVLHCPYCHGYEVRQEATGLLGNGDSAFEMAMLLANWTSRLTVFTNGPAAFTPAQADLLVRHGIAIEESLLERLHHVNGYLKQVQLKNGQTPELKALYARCDFEQHCPVPEMLGCVLTAEGYLQTNPQHETSISGIYASGDATTRMRTVANAVAMGTSAGMALNKKLIQETWQL